MGKGNKTTQIRNVLPRRMYKERGQLSHREHLGILEKRKDYKRRSDNFKQKDKIISKLRRPLYILLVFLIVAFLIVSFRKVGSKGGVEEPGRVLSQNALSQDGRRRAQSNP